MYGKIYKVTRLDEFAHDIMDLGLTKKEAVKKVKEYKKLDPDGGYGIEPMKAYEILSHLKTNK